MKHSKESIFDMQEPPIWRVIGANMLLWLLAFGFWWRTLGITSVDTIPTSMRRGLLTSEMALLLGIGFALAASWATLQVRKSRQRKWPANVKFGLYGAVLGICANATAMFAAALRISQVGY